MSSPDFNVDFCLYKMNLKEEVTVKVCMEELAIVPHLVIAVYIPLLSLHLHKLLSR